MNDRPALDRERGISKLLQRKWDSCLGWKNRNNR